jgi:serine/threonine protein kinase
VESTQKKKRARNRQLRDPFNRPTKTTIFNDLDGWFPKEEEVEVDKAVVWEQADGLDIVSPSSWTVRERGPSMLPPITGVPLVQAGNVDVEMSKLTLNEPVASSPTLGSISDEFYEKTGNYIPLRTGDESPTAGGINIPRTVSETPSENNGTNFSQESYRHQALQAHILETRQEEHDEAAWNYRDVRFDEGEMSPGVTDRYFFTNESAIPANDVGFGPASSDSTAIPPRATPRPAHGRIASVSGINTTQLPSGAAPAPLMHLIKGRSLGKGSQGICWLVKDAATSELYALKEILPQKTAEQHRQVLSSLWEEIRLLSSLQHENIVKVVGLHYVALPLESPARTPRTPHSPAPAPQMLLEYVSGGSIASLTRSLDPLPLPEDLAAFFGRQVAAGLAYLHSHHVVHRDIKGSNILVTPEGVVKISDFGISLDVSEYRPDSSSSFVNTEAGPVSSYHALARTAPRGTAFWMAPEAHRKLISAKIDCWSFGCLLIEMLTGAHPWPGMNVENVLHILRDEPGRVPPLPPVIGEETNLNRYPPGSATASPVTLPADIDLNSLGIVNVSKSGIVVSPEARKLMEDCVRYDPSQRPTAHEVMSYQFLRPLDYNFVERWPKLLEAARALQPPAAAEIDFTYISSYPNRDESETEDDDPEEGTDYDEEEYEEESEEEAHSEEASPELAEGVEDDGRTLNLS